MHPKKTAAELEQIRVATSLAANDLLSYTRLCDGGYNASKVHRYIARKLTSVADGSCRRLIINMPPRHGKSRLTTIELPTWMLGKDPKKKIVLASYSGNLAKRHSRSSRDRMHEPIYQAVFPNTSLDPLDKGAEEWSTTAGGIYKGVGIEGSLTGHGADLLIIDDPFKDHLEAHSKTTREAVWNWFLSVAYTRLSPTGAIVIIMTRWHTDDLVGRLMDPKRAAEIKEAGLQDEEKWEVVNFPAMAKHDHDELGRKEGEALYPEAYPTNRLKAIRQVLGSYLWAALYEGVPIPLGGNYINGGNFVIVNPDQVPVGLQWMRYWDLATDEKASADFTAGVAGALGPTPGVKDGPRDCLWLKMMIFGQWLWPKARTRIVEVATQERILVGVEAVSGFKTAYQNLREVLPNDIASQDYGVDRDKLTRALPWIAMTEVKKVILVAGDWNMPFKVQCESFPGGSNDDMVDCVSGVHKMLTSGRKVFVA